LLGYGIKCHAYRGFEKVSKEDYMEFLMEIGIVLLVVGALYLLNRVFNYKEAFIKIMVTESAYRMMIIFVYFVFRILGHVFDIPVISSEIFRSVTLGATLYLLQIPKKTPTL
jgi:hypothetical protein